ncbi:MAG: magnesium transporter [Phycisphaerales bacterium]|nr:magnesium transporter [Phycisphaerales bacterium]
MLALPLISVSSDDSTRDYSEVTIRDMMEPIHAAFGKSETVETAVAEIRGMVRRVFVTYAFVVDQAGRLEGVVTMRDLLLADSKATLESVMLKEPFWVPADIQLMEAMRLVLKRHYPIYPVCTPDRTLVGLIRGPAMFEAQAIEISAQAGSMVGVTKEERLSTPWLWSLRYRHPWLQLNLLTAFLAAAVVAAFQETLNQLVILAVFLPVLAGQSGNTGCQALAIALRGMTLGELKPGFERSLVMKEGLLGLLNGALVGVSAGIGMYIFARMQPTPEDPMVLAPAGQAFILGVVTFTAMIGSCMVSGLAGALIPMTLKRLGADPCTASSIFLTTATDVASMGIFLGLATLVFR